MALRRARNPQPIVPPTPPPSPAHEPPAGAKLKALRTARGLTLADLAHVTGKTKGYLSKLERADRLPPFTTLATLAQALGVEIDALLSTPDESNAADANRRGPASTRRQPRGKSPNIDLHRAADPHNRLVRGEAYAYLPLVRHYRGKYMSPFLMKLPPGKSRSFTHDGEEFTYVLDGAVDLIYERRRYRLNAGDGFYLDARLEHLFVNRSRREVSMVSVSFNYRRF